MMDETDDQDNNWQDPISREFARAKDAVTLRCRGTAFDTTIKEYRALLEEFLPKMGNREDLALEFRRRIVEDILVLAYEENEPFESCHKVWNELLQLGFSTIETQCMMSHFFVKCCNKYGHTEIGLAVLDPLVAELERLRAEPSVTKQATKFYGQELESLRKLRAKLEAEETT
jgi:hypothetical protein